MYITKLKNVLFTCMHFVWMLLCTYVNILLEGTKKLEIPKFGISVYVCGCVHK